MKVNGSRIMNKENTTAIRNEILELTKKYYFEKFRNVKFEKGVSHVNYAGRVFDEKELINLVDSSLDFWLTEGRFTEEFTEKISEFLDLEYIFLVNSGSSANLVALSALTSKRLGERRLQQGDEVISVAAGFPATVTPIIQNNLVPVFVDVDIPTYNIDTEKLKHAINEKTKCIFIAHTLGNPFNLEKVMRIAKDNKLWVIEDNCDAFGSKYKNKYTGTFGDISTISFYPAHHITTGEGGAVCTNDDLLSKIIKSFRDWGRDCYCASGENNTCGKRFSQKFCDLPYGYDHKYVYSEIGYNLKMTDMQAAIGAAQMDKLSSFTHDRKLNFSKYNEIFAKYKKYFILPEATEYSDPSWFSYIITVKHDAPFKKDELVRFLDSNLIETRNLFAGNMTKQPLLEDQNYRIASDLTNTDYIMNNTFFLGTFPGNTSEKLVYIDEKINEFLEKFE
ncbi:MAG: lipopolysaccharide biosynthesis protein RfbH [Melioribacteraceae bacterium]|nr:lipopolysaccharide biosynthesis protein RfbH [Melioribacteraceae bacterium]MCF8265927.1 lipopolysaccharide biosynthesis protein RfbH [Melioribacteraceae bacterium]MCF8297959.1 lipopolysaccharide biosynthesis protein RfbH [Saprospiraceae bacterium]